MVLLPLERIDYWHDIDSSLDELRAFALEARRWILKSTFEAGSGHPGGSLSMVEVLTSLYFKVMRHDPENPLWEDRDRFVLSKGHGAPGLYTVLALSGYFEK